MAANVKEIFAEHKWQWLAAALLIFAAGALAAIWLNARNAEVAVVPVMEATVTDDASRKIGESITEAQQRKNRLPEVVKNAKEKAVQGVGSDGDADIARRWNGLLGRYRLEMLHPRNAKEPIVSSSECSLMRIRQSFAHPSKHFSLIDTQLSGKSNSVRPHFLKQHSPR